MTLRRWVLALAVLTAVVAVSSALARSDADRQAQLEHRSNQVVDVHLRNGNVVIGRLIPNRPEQQSACGPNPRQLSAGGKRMGLVPIGTDTCSIRASAFTGTRRRAHLALHERRSR